MLVYLGRRCLLAIPTLFGVALIVFLLMRAVRGDVVTNLVGLQGNVSPERLVELRRMPRLFAGRETPALHENP